MTQVNRGKLDNPGLQRMPRNERDWSHYQNEVHKVEAGSFTPTFAGFSSDPSNAIVSWWKSASLVTVRLGFLTGTSDSANFQITNWPSNLTAPNNARYIPLAGFTDGGANQDTFGAVLVPQSPSLLTFYVDANFGGFATSMDKGFHIAGGVYFSYSIDG